jgi:hypothetical protein
MTSLGFEPRTHALKVLSGNQKNTIKQALFWFLEKMLHYCCARKHTPFDKNINPF